LTAKSGGGAIFVDANSVKISATKDITNVGNYVEYKGVKEDSMGGFLYLNSRANQGNAVVAEFAISQGATMTIGDGRAGYDSIAGDSATTINKTGAGSLVVNGSMEYFKGMLNVNEGSMAVNSTLGASDIAIASGATLTLGDNADIVLYGCSITLAEGATLELGANSTITVNLEEDFTGTTSLFNIADGATLIQNGESVSLAGLEEKMTITYMGETLDDSQWTFDATTGKLIASVVVPEPAEWAMILGGIVLGLAIYRRRK
jgi:autotransporter-associated beta strand protein